MPCPVRDTETRRFLMDLRKGDHVTYAPWHSPKAVIEAIVRRKHRDGTVTIEATFARKDDGSRHVGYLGVKQRVSELVLKPFN